MGTVMGTIHTKESFSSNMYIFKWLLLSSALALREKHCDLKKQGLQDKVVKF